MIDDVVVGMDPAFAGRGTIERDMAEFADLQSKIGRNSSGVMAIDVARMIWPDERFRDLTRRARIRRAARARKARRGWR